MPDATSSSQQSDRSGRVERQLEPFVKFPLWLIRRKASSVYEKAVLLALMSHGGSVFPSHRLLAEEAGCGLTKLKETLIELRKKGWITWEERFDTKGQISNIYKLHLGNLEWHSPSRDTTTPLAATRRPPSRDTTTPQSPHGDEIDSLNKNQLTRKTPLSPPKGETATEARQARRAKANSYQPDPSLVPESLKPISDQLIHCWVNFLVGVKSEQAFKTYLGQVQKILDDPCGGLDVVKDQLEQAEIVHATATKKWQSITYRNWQQIGRSQRLASIGNGQPPQRRRQHLPDLEAQFANDPL